MSTTYEPYTHPSAGTFGGGGENDLHEEDFLQYEPEDREDSGAGTDEQEPADQNQGDSAGAKAPSRPGRKRSGPDRGLIRRVAKKVVELQEADEQDVQLLASLLGSSSEDVTELTLAVMTSSRGDTAALADVKEIAEANEAERAVQALTMGKPRMKALWGVLAALGAVNATMPASDAKAALALAGATIDDAVIARLDRVGELAKRGW